MKITKNTIVGEVLQIDRGLAPFFLEIGMHCLSCPAATSETIEEACMVHGADCDEFVARLNEFLEDEGVE